MKSNQPKQSRGGKRPFSGRKKADYKTTTISFRVRVEWADEIKALVKEFKETKTQ